MENIQAPNGLFSSTLEQRLFEKGYLFEFHAAVKALEKKYGSSILFKTHLSFAFKGSDVAFIARPQDNLSVPEVYVNFWGLEAGPLPEPYREALITHRNHALHDFFSIFNTRLLRALHDLRSNLRLCVRDQLPEKTLYGKSFLSLMGLGTQTLHNRLRVPDRSLFYYTALLWQKPRSREGIAQIIKHFLKTQVRVRDFVGQWVHINPSQYTNLSKKFHRLGETAVLGKAFWNQQETFSLEIGPLSKDLFKQCLKNGTLYPLIVSIVHFYHNTLKPFYITLFLKEEEDMKAAFDGQSLLGWTTWLKKPAPKAKVRLSIPHVLKDAS